MRLEATTPDGSARYHLSAGITLKLAMRLASGLSPGGLLGISPGCRCTVPLALDVSLTGPRDDAELQFQIGLGAAEMQGAGTLGLDPNSPKADAGRASRSVVSVFCGMAGQNVAGSTKLHLVVAQQKNGSSALSLNGDDYASTAATFMA